ncbi:MAG: hypothetical protein IJ654_04445 [Bacteroidales bacterium]|nr:hypothetical protein [Bacteroidales bacterium]
MNTSRINLLRNGLSPRALLPLSLILSLAFASAFCFSACAPQESPSPEKPGPVTHIEWAFRPTESPGGARTGTRADDWYLIRRMDLFVFDDDGIRALDSYTRSFAYSPTSVDVRSASGAKRAVAIANLPLPDGFVTSVSHYEDLHKVIAELTEDDPAFPVMSGEARFMAGEDRNCAISLEPVMSTVEIHSLKCQFQGSYAGQSLKRVKVYLTGISCRSELLRQEGFLPTESLNVGGLSERDLARLPYSGMVYRYLGNGTPAGGGRVYGGTALYCYPNETDEETLGSPFTRLVIEGLLDGKTCYYAIPVNRGDAPGDGPLGIGRNRRYVFDITLTRPGTESPGLDAAITP